MANDMLVLVSRVGSALSEVVEEGEQCIAGLEPPEAFACRRYILKRLLLGFEVRLNVDMSGFRTLMPESEGDPCDVGSRIQHMHGGCVSQLVRRDTFRRQAGTGPGRFAHGALQNVVHAVAR